MKKIASAAFAILLFALLLSLVSCTRGSTAQVKANKNVVALVKTWDPQIAFYTSRKDPLKSIEGLRQAEIACFGPELSANIQAFYDAAGTQRAYGNAVQVITPSGLSFDAEKAPRLYLVHSNYGPKLKDAVKVRFSE